MESSTIIPIDDEITFEIGFDPMDREEGYKDDIAFIIREIGPRDYRIFASDETKLLLTPGQAEQMARALVRAADASRNTPD